MKPNWDVAPEWAQFFAKDLDGSCFWYEHEQVKGSCGWRCKSGRAESLDVFVEWQDSLTGRE